MNATTFLILKRAITFGEQSKLHIENYLNLTNINIQVITIKIACTPET